MILFSLLIISLLSLSLFRVSVYDFISPVAEKTHAICLQKLPENSSAITELKAIVCAHNFENLNQSQLYISSGLIHLFVVSGAHLTVIEKILMKLKINKLSIFVVLIFYGLACNLNAPVARCLVAYSIAYYLSSKKIYWPPHFQLLIIGACCLCLNPTWISSLSLQMSWLAAFLVILGESFFKNSSAIFKQSLFYFTLLPSIVFFQFPEPICILINMILTPVLELVLFPLGLLVLCFNFISPVFDFLIQIFKTVLEKMELNINLQTSQTPEFMTIFNWTLILFLHFIAHIVYVYRKRKV